MKTTLFNEHENVKASHPGEPGKDLNLQPGTVHEPVQYNKNRKN